MIDAERFAALICDWCLEVEEGQQIKVETSTLAQDVAVALHNAILARGGWPLLRLTPPLLEADFYRHATDRQLDGVAPLALAEERGIDASMRVLAPGNTNALAGVDPGLPARAARARQPLMEARAAHRWSIAQWPTAALAQQAGMGERDYAAFMERALFLDRPDPLAAWRALSEMQAALVRRLDSAREIRIESDGTDLRLNVAGRSWVNSDGRRNMPSGEVFTGPLEDSASGTIFFDVPSTGRGADVSGVELRFEAGRVVHAHARQGDEHLQAALATDDGARFLGEARDRHQRRHRPRHRLDAARREDRWDDPPGARPLVPGDRRDQHLRAALGSDLRPPQRRRRDGRRRGHDPGWRAALVKLLVRPWKSTVRLRPSGESQITCAPRGGCWERAGDPPLRVHLRLLER